MSEKRLYIGQKDQRGQAIQAIRADYIAKLCQNCPAGLEFFNGGGYDDVCAIYPVCNRAPECMQKARALRALSDSKERAQVWASDASYQRELLKQAGANNASFLPTRWVLLADPEPAAVDLLQQALTADPEKTRELIRQALAVLKAPAPVAKTL